MTGNKASTFETWFPWLSGLLPALYAFLAFFHPESFSKVAPNILDVLAIVSGISLAALGLFTSSSGFERLKLTRRDEQKRVEEKVKREDAVFSKGIVLVFSLQLLAVVFLIFFLFVYEIVPEKNSIGVSIFSALTAFLSVLGVVLSIRLPLLFLAMVKRRSELT